MLNLLQASTCKVELECDETEVSCVAGGMVEHVVCTAENLLASDPGRCFLYKRPVADEDISVERDVHFNNYIDDGRAYKSSSTNSTLPSEGSDSMNASNSRSVSSSDSDNVSIVTERRLHDHIEWPTIGEFRFGEAVSQIRDFISLWHLTPATLCDLIIPQTPHAEVPPLGVRYMVEAHFSKPTPMCPNPLAVAKAYFQVYVSNLLPKDYPVMVTYRFEGYRNVYYALGERCLRSLRFQRYYIDTIICMKLAFYAEICELRHPQGEQEPKQSLQQQQEQARSSRLSMKASIDDDPRWRKGSMAQRSIESLDIVD